MKIYFAGCADGALRPARAMLRHRPLTLGRLQAVPPALPMALLVAMLPSVLKRKRGAEEEQARGMRAALSAAPRPAVVDKCMELFAANRELAMRVREMERALAARDDAAQAAIRATVRDELARHLAPRWTFCAHGDSEPESDTSDEETGADVISEGDLSSESDKSLPDDDDDGEDEDDEGELTAKHVRFDSPSDSAEEEL